MSTKASSLSISTQADEQTAHTPGPWTTHSNGHAHFVSVGDHAFAAVWEKSCCGLSMPGKANARLITAAPDLLLALCWLWKMYGSPHGQDYYDEMALCGAAVRAAIAKATGAQS